MRRPARRACRRSRTSMKRRVIDNKLPEHDRDRTVVGDPRCGASMRVECAALFTRGWRLMTFTELGLSQKSLAALGRAGFEAPTPIQAQAIPPALQGKDVIGSAATGTGKTLAFVLPLLDRLEGKHGTRALVLAPTRELALQIGTEVERFAHGRHLRSAVVIGGVGMRPQVEAFQRGVAIVVATPGRLNDD